VDRGFMKRDIANFGTALHNVNPVEGFLTAASPGVISLFLENRHYASHEAYVFALADAMKVEYQAIHEAGFVLQVDAPDLAMGRHIQFANQSLKAFLDNATLHVEALNRALDGIPPEKVRVHLCWGNYEGPHHHDVALKDIIEVVLRVHAMGISFVAANPRHEHEWKVWNKVALPDDKVLIPGVIDTTSNIIEHPELVAERIVRFAELVGRKRVIAGTDCGFSTFAGLGIVDPSIAWAKIDALVAGARIASQALARPASRLRSTSHRLARRIRATA
jgi:5-methyltetrahydropteroyltriglutamate--homocysteine methyltransferase